MFAWKPPNDTNDININIDLNEDMDLFGTDLESLTQESCSSKITKEKPKAMSIPKHVSQLDDINKNKVITTMKLMYFTRNYVIWSCY